MSRLALRRAALARARRAAGWLAPFGLMEPRRRRQAERADAERMRRLAEERRLLVQRLAEHAQRGGPPPFSYAAAVAALVADGHSEHMVRDGSIPESSLDLVAQRLAAHLTGEPPLALHVGNFVGVSLAHLTATLRAHRPDALVVSVDPGMPHRGIEAPDRIALRLLERFGLTANSMVITGFSRRKSLRDDGLVCGPEAASTMAVEHAAGAMRADAACEDVLPNLARLLPGRFDVVLLDGNHDAGYLRDELADVDRLLRPGGLLVLDDVQEHAWPDVVAIFDALSSAGEGYERVAHDGRVGLLARRALGEARVA